MKPYINWFFQIWSRDFRQAKIEVFETIMFIAIGHLFGHFNPKQFADSLGVPHQTLYNRIQKLSVYTVKRLLIKFMVKHAVETLRPVLAKSASTLSRALITVSVDKQCNRPTRQNAPMHLELV